MFLILFPHGNAGKNGVSLWELKDIEQRQAKERETLEKLMQGELRIDSKGQVVGKGEGDEEDEFDHAFGGGEDIAQIEEVEPMEEDE